MTDPQSASVEVTTEPIERVLAEGIWAMSRKRLGLRPDFMPNSRTDFVAEAARRLAHQTTLARGGELVEAVDWLRRNADGLKADVALAHRSRGNGCTEWMVDDDRDFRSDLAKHLAALSTATPPEPQPASNDAVREALEPVLHWYQSDEHPERPLAEVVADIVADLQQDRAFVLNPPKHKFWVPGEPDCPREIKAGNGELHTLRCKVCGQDNPRDDFCRASSPSPASVDEGLGHDEAIEALCGCAATTTLLSYQEAIEGYFTLRRIAIP